MIILVLMCGVDRIINAGVVNESPLVDICCFDCWTVSTGDNQFKVLCFVMLTVLLVKIYWSENAAFYQFNKVLGALIQRVDPHIPP